MIDERNKEIASTRVKLQNLIGLAEDKLALAKQYEKEYKKITDLHNREKDMYETVRGCHNHLVAIYKNILDKENKRMLTQRKNIDACISYALSMVPQAQDNSVHLEFNEQKKEAYIANAQGHDVCLQEGGAFRTILSAIIRYASLLSMPDSLPIILFDESFFPCSEDTMRLLREYIKVMADSFVIVIIDQRGNLLGGLTDKTFVFKKEGAYTQVREDNEYNSTFTNTVKDYVDKTVVAPPVLEKVSSMSEDFAEVKQVNKVVPVEQPKPVTPTATYKPTPTNKTIFDVASSIFDD